MQGGASRVDSAPPHPLTQILPWMGAGALLLAVAVHQANQDWAFDIYVYLAAVREFASSGLHPAHPLIAGAPAEDPFLSPYALALGTIARELGVAPLTVLACAGPVNVALLGTGLWRFVRSLGGAPGAFALSALFTLTAWGVQPWTFAGFFSVNSIGTVAPLGSTFAAAAALLLLAVVQETLSGRLHAARVVAMVVLLWLVVLVHPVTLTWLGPMVVGLLVAAIWRSDRDRRGQLVVAGAATIGVVLTLFWPWIPVTQVVGSATDFDVTNSRVLVGFLPRTVLAWPGLFLLGRRLWRRQPDGLAIGTFSALGVYGAALLTGHAAFGRALPGVMFGAHIAMGSELAAWWARTADPRSRRVAAGATVVLVGVGLLGGAAGVARAIPRPLLRGPLADDPRLDSEITPFIDALPGPIGRQDLVLASNDVALEAAALSGKVIAAPATAPFLPLAEVQRRQAAVDQLLVTSATWDEQVQRWKERGIRWVVLSPAEASRLGVDQAPADAVVSTTPSVVIVRVD